MGHVSLPQLPGRVAQPRAHRPVAVARSIARVPRGESLAAPLTLAAVVVLALMLAVAMAIVTAIGA